MARRKLLAALFLSLLLGARVAAGAAGGGPPAFDEPAARALLRALPSAGVPHPIGSPAQRALRAGIAERLRALGYQPELQRAFVCSDFRRSCGAVENVLARLPGRSPGAVLLNSHYDTQPATPGAGDPMAGVAAALEVARLLRGETPLEHGVVFLFNDGEEAGLLGSTAFVRLHPWAREVRAVVNLDARGSRGASQAGAFVGGSAGLLRAWARSGAPVRGSSLLPALVGLLPNTNDLAVFDELRVPGVLVGFVEGLRSYHSAHDTIEHLAPESLRTQGEIALGLVREMASGTLPDPNAGDAVFFAAGPWLARWPAAWALALAAVAALVLLASLRWPRQGRRLPARELLWGAAAVALAVLAGALGGLAAEKARQALVPIPSDRVAHPTPSALAVFLAAAAAAWAVTWLLRRRSGGTGHAAATACALAAAGLVAAWKLPGASFLFLVPVAAAAVGAWWSPRAMAIAGAAATAALWGPALWSFHHVFGLAAPTPLGGVLGLLLGWLAPFAPPPRWRWTPAAAVAALAAAALAVAARLPTFTVAQPQALTLHHVTLHAPAPGGPARAWWLANGWPLPDAFARAARFDLDADPLPWSRTESGSVASAPAAHAPPPELVEVEHAPGAGGERRVRALLRSRRGAAVLHLVVPDGRRLREVTVDGVTVPPDALVRYAIHREGWEVLTFWAPPARGHRIELVVAGTEALAAEVVDRTTGAPALALPLLRARPASSAPSGFGDSTIVRQPVTL